MENTEEFMEQNDNVEIQYIISTQKYIILSILSLGFYDVLWHYKAWRFFNQKNQLDIMPAMRAMNSIFFIYSLFKTILKFSNEKGYDKKYPVILLSVGYILLLLFNLLPFPFLLFSKLSVIFLIQPFQALNFAKRQSNELKVIEQTTFNRRQKVIIFIGAFFWFSLIASILIETP